jgi:hypothetical protein
LSHFTARRTIPRQRWNKKHVFPTPFFALDQFWRFFRAWQASLFATLAPAVRKSRSCGQAGCAEVEADKQNSCHIELKMLFLLDGGPEIFQLKIRRKRQWGAFLDRAAQDFSLPPPSCLQPGAKVREIRFPEENDRGNSFFFACARV